MKKKLNKMPIFKEKKSEKNNTIIMDQSNKICLI